MEEWRLGSNEKVGLNRSVGCREKVFDEKKGCNRGVEELRERLDEPAHTTTIATSTRNTGFFVGVSLGVDITSVGEELRVWNQRVHPSKKLKRVKRG